MNSKNQVLRFARMLSLTVVAIGIGLLLADPAMAVGTGWTAAADNVKSFGNTAIGAMIALCAVGGVGAVGYAGKLLLKKSGDRGDDVEWSKIGYAVLGGAFLLSIAFIATSTIETLGGDTSNVNSKVISPQ